MADAIPPTSPAPVLNLRSGGSPIPDNLGGTTVNVPSTPATALQDFLNGTGIGAGQGALNVDGTHKGNTYVCPAGAVYGPIVMPVTTGSGYTCIRTGGTLPAQGTRVSPSDAGQMFKVQSAGTAAPDGVSPLDLFAVEIRADTGTGGRANGYRFVGMEATHPNGNSMYNIVDVKAQRISLESCYLHANAAQTFLGRCMRIYEGDFQIWDSYLSGAAAVGYEAQALLITTYDVARNGRFHIENCSLQGAGENIIINDQFAGAPTLDVTIRRSHFFKPLTWFPTLLHGEANGAYAGLAVTIKNLFEIKWAYRVLLEGNIFENCWGGAQDGTAILFNGGRTSSGGTSATDIRAEDVMFRSNWVKRTPYWLSINVSDTVGGFSGGSPHARMAFVNNLITEVYGGMRLLNHYSTDIAFEHNTAVPIDGTVPSGAQSWFIASDSFGSSWQRLTWKRNVWGRSQFSIFIQGAGGAQQPITTATFDTFLPDRSFLENVEFGLAGSSPAGVALLGTAASIGLNTTDGTLSAGSPLKVGGANGGSDGKDIGVDHVVLANALAGVVVPAVPVANFTYAQTVGTFTIQFTDLSQNSPTSWFWDGPDGFRSSLQSPSFTFPTAGDKSVTLTATNALGSSAPVTFVVTVAVLPGFTHVRTTIKAGSTVATITVPSLTAGNLLYVAAQGVRGASAVTVDSVTDAAGNAYTAVSAGAVWTGGYLERSFYTIVTVGSGSPVVLTVNMTGTGPINLGIVALEYHPNLGAITFVGASPMTIAGGSPSPMDSGPVTTPATGGSLLIGTNDHDTVVPTVPVGWTSRMGTNQICDKLDPTASTTYHFQPTYPGTQNWAAQLAVFASGVSGAPPDTTAPTVPTGLAHATPVATDHVDLTWTASFDAVGVANYNVRRDGVVVGTVTGTTFTDSGLQSNTAYSYTVRANDAVPNSSAYSSAHVVTTGVIETGTALPPRFMRGFGLTRGTGPTDAILTPALGHGVQRTITFWLRVDGFAAQQCVFTKSSDAIQTLTERVLIATNGTLRFQRQWSTGTGEWSIPVPSLGVRHFIVIRLDTSVPANVPTIKVDNIQQTVTAITQPTSGVAMQNTAGYMLGNFPGGAVLGGDLARFAVYNFITTDAQDAALFSANDPLGIGVGAVQYIQLDGSSDEPDMVTPFTASVVTGTKTQDYEPPSFVTVVSAGRRMVGWVR